MKLIILVPKMRFSWRQLFSWFLPSFLLLFNILNVQTLDIDLVCPRMLQKVFNGYAPIGKLVHFVKFKATITNDFMKNVLIVNFISI